MFNFCAGTMHGNILTTYHLSSVRSYFMHLKSTIKHQKHPYCAKYENTWIIRNTLFFYCQWCKLRYKCCKRFTCIFLWVLVSHTHTHDKKVINAIAPPYSKYSLDQCQLITEIIYQNNSIGSLEIQVSW